MTNEDQNITKLIPVREAMEMMGVKRTTFYAEAAKGNITLKHFGARKTLVPLESIQQWIDALPSTSNVEGK